MKIKGGGPVPRVEWEDGRAIWVHACRYPEPVDPQYQLKGVQWVQLPDGPDGWQQDEASDTVSPSILCGVCNVHGFWRAGQWVPA